MAGATENTPLFAKTSTSTSDDNAHASNINNNSSNDNDPRLPLFLFLEAKTPAGLKYESFTIFLIFLSVITFILSSIFLPEYNTESNLATKCGNICDAIWFGNYDNNAISWLGIGATSITEIVVVGVFTVDYILRLYTADLIDARYAGFWGRIKFIPTFFSLVDLASTVPFYVDSFFLPNTDLAASTFLRMFRLLRMMKVEGRFDLALGMIDDVFYAQRGVLGTALFVGVTVWGVLSSFFYVAERKNPNMIYCGAAPDWCPDIDTDLCTTDEWGIVDCSAAGCESKDGKEICWNLYRSIIDSSFWTLTNLFGEFPLIDQHNFWGKVLGTFTAVFAVAVFALPVGVLASGFEDQIAKRREQKALESTTEDEEVVEDDIVGDESTLRGRLWNLFHRERTPRAKLRKTLINSLIIVCAVSFIFDSVAEKNGWFHVLLSWFQFLSFVVFSVEYFLRMYSAGEDPRYRSTRGLGHFSLKFLQVIDVLSIFPYWIGLVTISGPGPSLSLLLKIFHVGSTNKAFSTFGNVINEHKDVLAVTGFSAMLLWIFFASILYFTERDNPDEEMKTYYNTIPNAMWITLLNLSGECPLAHYSNIGKVIEGIIGLFATAVFGIPIGILGAGFEELVTSKYEDTPDDEDQYGTPTIQRRAGFQMACYQFVNGIGSKAATVFELSIYCLIGATVTIGILQTVPGLEHVGEGIEWLAVIIFTVEYVIRFIGAGVDPEFVNTGSNGFTTRLKYVFSFYSIIDLMAIVPFYIAYVLPSSWIDAHDEYFRMMRILRLLKLDKYVPSISLVDDVVRLKKQILLVAGYAAATLLFLFSAAMYVIERSDDAIEVDPLPLYGCVENCYMSDRYRNFFSSVPLTGIHLTGDFPLIEYGGLGRCVLFFVVIAAVGVVSIPSGVIASGFAEIVNGKTKSSSKIGMHAAGDDWFDIKYRKLEGQPPPLSKFGPDIDVLQIKVKEYLDGKADEISGKVSRTHFSKMGRTFFFSLIISNVLAVILESIPEIDRAVGNSAGNFFDIFEALSVLCFTVDYGLRLFSARKSREALFSPWVYATTFFGLVDLISILPWYVQVVLARTGHLNGDEAKIFRIFRIFRVLQLEDFLVAFSKLDNVFRASKDVLKATGLMAVIVWVGSSALFFIFEEDNPNFRQCDPSIPLIGEDKPGCYDFESTSACNEFYPGMCSQTMFTNMPNSMYFVSVFLGGEWGTVDFTWQGKLVCMFLCIAGIALYSIPVGTLFDSFGAVIGLSEEDEGEDED